MLSTVGALTIIGGNIIKENSITYKGAIIMLVGLIIQEDSMIHKFIYYSGLVCLAAVVTK